MLGDIVYACGLNNYGQLGLGSKYENITQLDNLTIVPSLCYKGFKYYNIYIYTIVDYYYIIILYILYNYYLLLIFRI